MWLSDTTAISTARLLAAELLIPHTALAWGRCSACYFRQWDGGKAGAELYDHNNDPYEWRNLANERKLAKTIAELKKLLPSNRKTL
jgi:hypothetical protein